MKTCYRHSTKIQEVISVLLKVSANQFSFHKTFFSFFDLLDDNDVVTNYFSRKEKKRGLLAAFQGIKESLLPTRGKKAY